MKLPMFGSNGHDVPLDSDLPAADTKEARDDELSSGTTPKSSRVRMMSVYGVVLVLTAAFVALLLLKIPLDLRSRSDGRRAPAAGQDHFHCGNSSAQALKAGCTFNQLLWAWLPPDCPEYANQEFMKAGDWRYYLDPLGKQRATGASWTAAMDNEINLWGEKGEHLSHCVFMFLSLGRIVHDGTAYPPRLVSNEHLDHCAEYLLEALRKGDDWQTMENSVGKVSYEEYCFRYH